MSFGYAELLKESEQVVEFTFDGATWEGARGALDQSKDLALGGYGLIADMQLVVWLDQFTDADVAPPQEQSEITIDSVVYRVLAMATDMDEEFRVLNLQKQSKGV